MIRITIYLARLGTYFLLSCALFAPLLSSAKINVRDDFSRSITLTSPALRVISLAPHSTEILFSIGAGQTLLASIEGSDYPPAAKRLPTVGNSHSLNIEKIIAFKPDLVIAWQSNKNLEHHLAAHHIPLYYSDPNSIPDILNTIKNIGTMTGYSQSASNLNYRLQQNLNTLKRNKPQTLTSVFLSISTQPLYTLGKNNWQNDALRFCGGKNSFEDVPYEALMVNLETITAKAPEIIINLDNSKYQSFWGQRAKHLKAVKSGRIYNLSPDFLSRPGPRFIEGVKALCNVLYP